MRHRQIVPATLAAGIAAVACFDSRATGPTDPDGPSLVVSPDPCTGRAAIEALIERLYPKNGLYTDATSRFGSIHRQYCERENVPSGQAQARSLSSHGFDKAAGGELIGQQFPGDQVVARDVVELAFRLHKYVNSNYGVDLADLSTATDIAIGKAFPDQPFELTVPSEDFGTRAPIGFFNQQADVVMYRAPDGTPFQGVYREYPPRYRVNVSPAAADDPSRRASDITAEVGICPGPIEPDRHDLGLLRVPQGGEEVTETQFFPTVYPGPSFLDCTEGSPSTIGAAPGEATGTLLAAWRTVRRAGSVVWRFVTPSVAYAVDGGLGTRDAPEYSGWVAAERPLSEGFESDAGWTMTGFWNRSPLANIVDIYHPVYVTLPNDDNALPSPFTGSGAAWYGEPPTGSFLGAQLAGDVAGSGGISQNANSGLLVSPVTWVPAFPSGVRLRFVTWFEIEGVNPSGFDRMLLSVEDVATGAVTQLGGLNPAADPVGSGETARPFSSGGLYAAPVWVPVEVDISAFAGKEVRFRFAFETGDELYNGFRGWIVDDVEVRAVPTSSTGSALTSLQSSGSTMTLSPPAPAPPPRSQP